MPKSVPSAALISSQVVEARRFYLDTPAGCVPEFAVVCGGWERCAPDFCVRRSQFPYFAVEVVVDGEGEVRLDGVGYALARGSVFAYGPSTVHEIVTRPDAPMSKYFVDFTGVGAAGRLALSGLDAGSIMVAATVDEVQATFEQLIHTGRRHGKEVAGVTERLLEILFLRIAEGRVDGRGPCSPQALATFNRCRDYLEHNWPRLRTVEEAAEACHVAPAYLSRLFARFSGGSPLHYLLRLKMNHAATLLETSALSVRETAEALGMDPFHFSRVFKRIHHLSPRAFQRARFR